MGIKDSLLWRKSLQDKPDYLLQTSVEVKNIWNFMVKVHVFEIDNVHLSLYIYERPRTK